MAVFADLASMLERFEELDLVQLTDRAGTGMVDEARIEGALVSADALIIAAVAARYEAAPSFAGHPLLRDIACDHAFSLLWKSDAPDWVKDRRKAAADTLAQIAKGVLKLDEGREEATARPDAILIEGPARRFTRDSLGSF